MTLAVKIKDGDWTSVRQAIQKLNKKLGPNATPTFAGATLTGHIIPNTDSLYNLGSSSPKYWANAFIDRIYLNSTAYLYGTGAPGVLSIKGFVYPDADSTYDLGAGEIFWRDLYTDRIFLNSLATLDGSVS